MVREKNNSILLQEIAGAVQYCLVSVQNKSLPLISFIDWTTWWPLGPRPPDRVVAAVLYANRDRPDTRAAECPQSAWTIDSQTVTVTTAKAVEMVIAFEARPSPVLKRAATR